MFSGILSIFTGSSAANEHDRANLIDRERVRKYTRVDTQQVESILDSGTYELSVVQGSEEVPYKDSKGNTHHFTVPNETHYFSMAYDSVFMHCPGAANTHMSSAAISDMNGQSVVTGMQLHHHPDHVAWAVEIIDDNSFNIVEFHKGGEVTKVPHVADNFDGDLRVAINTVFAQRLLQIQSQVNYEALNTLFPGYDGYGAAEISEAPIDYAKQGVDAFHRPVDVM